MAQTKIVVSIDEQIFRQLDVFVATAVFPIAVGLFRRLGRKNLGGWNRTA
jgi:hypothetical protein